MWATFLSTYTVIRPLCGQPFLWYLVHLHISETLKWATFLSTYTVKRPLCGKPFLWHLVHVYTEKPSPEEPFSWHLVHLYSVNACRKKRCNHSDKGQPWLHDLDETLHGLPPKVSMSPWFWSESKSSVKICLYSFTQWSIVGPPILPRQHHPRIIHSAQVSRTDYQFPNSIYYLQSCFIRIALLIYTTSLVLLPPCGNLRY